MMTEAIIAAASALAGAVITKLIDSIVSVKKITTAENRQGLELVFSQYNTIIGHLQADVQRLGNELALLRRENESCTKDRARLRFRIKVLEIAVCQLKNPDGRCPELRVEDIVAIEDEAYDGVEYEESTGDEGPSV